MEAAAYFLPVLGATLGFRLLRRHRASTEIKSSKIKSATSDVQKSSTAPSQARCFLGAFIDGQWAAASNTGTIDVLDPCTGQAIGQISCCSAKEANKALKAAEASRKNWAAMSLKRREQLILAFRDKLLEHKDELVELDILETGKVSLSGLYIHNANICFRI